VILNLTGLPGRNPFLAADSTSDLRELAHILETRTSSSPLSRRVAHDSVKPCLIFSFETAYATSRSTRVFPLLHNHRISAIKTIIASCARAGGRPGTASLRLLNSAPVSLIYEIPFPDSPRGSADETAIRRALLCPSLPSSQQLFARERSRCGATVGTGARAGAELHSHRMISVEQFLERPSARDRRRTRTLTSRWSSRHAFFQDDFKKCVRFISTRT